MDLRSLFSFSEGFQASKDAKQPSSETAHVGSHRASGERLENGIKIKTLPISVVKDIEQKNIARRLAGLSALIIQVRRCLTCGSYFESSGNRTCGCSARVAGSIAGREII
jgi:hypothetical protein